MPASKGHLMEYADISVGSEPAELGSGGSTGDWISLKNYDRVAVVFISKGAASSGQDLKFTVQQAKDNVGGSVKGLNVKHYLVKSSTTALLDKVNWTKSTVGTTSGSTFKVVKSKEAKLIVIDIGSEELDVDGKFDFVRVNVADTGVTSGLQWGATLMIPYNAKHPQETTALVGVQS